MFRLYYNFAKKSIPALVLGSFLLSSMPVSAMEPNDPSFTYQQGIWEQIGAPQAWDYTVGSKRVTVAIIDTGADIWNEDLKSNVWINPYEIPDNGYDDDNNGYIDDVHGWNFIENSNDVRTSVFDNADDPGAVVHGTVIAGLIGSVGNNKKNGVGLNWQVQIMPLRAISSDGSGYFSNIMKAIRYAMDNGADVISMSMVGDSTDSRFENLLYQAYKKGIVIVAAAGNDQMDGLGNLDANPLYPVCLDNNYKENWILGVSSIDTNDHLSRFADYGKCVDLVAPGQNIFSTERYAPVYGFTNEFGGPWQGTSFAVPLVAGAAALLKAQRPDWSAGDIIQALLNSATNIDSQNPDFNGRLGYGRLNIGKAMSTAASVAVPINSTPNRKYYFKKEVIYSKEGNAKYFLASVNTNVAVVGVAATRSFNYKRDEVAVLIKRGKNYFVQFYTDTGTKWKEVLVPSKDYTTKKLPTNISMSMVDQTRQVKIEFTEKIVKKGKKTQLVKTSKTYSWKD